jgi:hypothetical protein
MLIAPLLWLTLGAVTASPIEDSWYRVRVSVPSALTLDRLQNSDLDLMECIPHLGTTDVAIGPGEFGKLEKGGYTYTIVSKLEDPRNWEDRHGGVYTADGDEYRLHYYNADQILAFYEGLRSQHPTVITRRNIGTSINGETIWAYRFINPNTARNPETLNNVVIESLIHAREWITGSSVMHIARTLTDRLSDPVPSRFLSGQAVWIVPIANPDGYRYTWTTNRLWRKNRRHNSGGSYGVDINRNYAKGWGGTNGSSGTQSSETYRGTAAFSEPESQAVRDFMLSLPRVAGYIDYHSYAQLILEPWGYTTTPTQDATYLSSIGAQMKSQMDGFGATYQHGPTGQILYIASGTSNDWVYDVWRKPGFGVELRDTGNFGFELPEDQIYATQDEVLAGFLKFLQIVGY